MDLFGFLPQRQDFFEGDYIYNGRTSVPERQLREKDELRTRWQHTTQGFQSFVNKDVLWIAVALQSELR